MAIEQKAWITDEGIKESLGRIGTSALYGVHDFFFGQFSEIDSLQSKRSTAATEKIFVRFDSEGTKLGDFSHIKLEIVMGDALEAEIASYEEKLGMSAEELLRRWQKGTAPNTFEAKLLRSLIRYR